MKRFNAILGVLMLFFLPISLLAQMDQELIGKWELLKIERGSQTLIPQEAERRLNKGYYYLDITEDGFKYNLEINTCLIMNLEIKDNEIIAEDGSPCTKMCCDDRYSDFYKNLKYTGKYQVSESGSRLIIENDKGKFFFKRKY